MKLEYDEAIVSEMSNELKQLVLNWISRLDVLDVSADLTVNIVLSILDSGMKSVIGVCERISGRAAS